MVMKIISQLTEILTLQEYLAYVTDNVDPDDSASIVESAPYLQRLALNKELLNDFILEPVKDLALKSQRGSIPLDASIKLAETADERFLIRANIWKVPEERGGTVGHEKRLYSYDAPHDHNFDFLTVGYFGPGYETEMWQYDYSDSLKPGDHVNLNYLGRDTLRLGDIMYYEKSKDIHSQLAPFDLSISINLLVKAKDIATRQQFYFDIEKQQVAGMVLGPTLRRKELMDIAGFLKIEEAIEPLLIIASNYPCERTRQSAVENIAKIDKTMASHVSYASAS